jgi:hypothetical protein
MALSVIAPHHKPTTNRPTTRIGIHNPRTKLCLHRTIDALYTTVRLGVPWRSPNHPTLGPQVLNLGDDFRKLIVGESNQFAVLPSLLIIHRGTMKLRSIVRLQNHWRTDDGEDLQ